jgi:hypothetical protein
LAGEGVRLENYNTEASRRVSHAKQTDVVSEPCLAISQFVKAARKQLLRCRRVGHG